MAEESSFFQYVAGSYRKLLANPIFLAVFLLLYFTVVFMTYQSLAQKRELAKLQHDRDIQNEKMTALLEEQKLLLERGDINSTVDIFRSLSFKESVVPEDNARLQTAQSLNSFARYALIKRDFKTAQDKLEQSRHLLQTLEAQYYLGVLFYLQGRNEDAASLWKAISRQAPIPDDLWLYIALAEYRQGNIEEARLYAQRYGPRREK